jgi:transketolase
MTEITDLEKRASEIRKLIVRMVCEAGSGHVGGSLGSADFFTGLYFGDVLENKDKVVLSAGHYCPVLYACLAEKGLFDKNELMSLRKLESRLQGHPHFEWKGKNNLPGIETTSGPLGQGVSQAVGMALALRMDGDSNRVICFMGDGEQDEGQVWEAYMLAGRENLSNLTLVVDRNNIQIDGKTDDVMPLEPLKDKLASFNLEVREIDGHDFEQIIKVLKKPADKTIVIILKTTPGKGVSFMENNYLWHGKVPSKEEVKLALKELSLN